MIEIMIYFSIFDKYINDFMKSNEYKEHFNTFSNIISLKDSEFDKKGGKNGKK